MITAETLDTKITELEQEQTKTQNICVQAQASLHAIGGAIQMLKILKAEMEGDSTTTPSPDQQ